MKTSFSELRCTSFLLKASPSRLSVMCCESLTLARTKAREEKLEGTINLYALTIVTSSRVAKQRTTSTSAYDVALCPRQLRLKSWCSHTWVIAPTLRVDRTHLEVVGHRQSARRRMRNVIQPSGYVRVSIATSPCHSSFYPSSFYLGSPK